MVDRTHGNTVHGVTQAQFAAITRWLGLSEMEAMVTYSWTCILVSIILVTAALLIINRHA